ncbi:MAG: hypothetical protein HY701_11610 [Gemmatimonadetes bacterium]|nr:hypothetical protein [Gemmatimonadota bacterium]
MSSAAWVRAYYLATPLFALVDWLGANVRAVGLAGHPEWRAGYYAVCTIAGLLVHFRPRSAAYVGLVESSTNVLLLVLAVFLPYFDAVASVASGGTAFGLPFTARFVVNFLLSGAVWVAIFQWQLLELRAGSGAGRPGE